MNTCKNGLSLIAKTAYYTEKRVKRHNIVKTQARARRLLFGGGERSIRRAWLVEAKRKSQIVLVGEEGIVASEGTGVYLLKVNTMKRSCPWDEQVEVSSESDESSSDTEMEICNGNDTKAAIDIAVSHIARDVLSDDLLMRRAAMYQDYMKQIPIPRYRGSVIPYTSWMGLARSMKQLYNQPLHYLTNILLKQWDQLRIDSEDEYIPLDDIIHPCKAEASVWLLEEVHRKTSCHLHVAKLWKEDPMHHAFVDSIFPTLEGSP